MSVGRRLGNIDITPNRLLAIIIVTSAIIRLLLVFWNQSYLVDYGRTDLGAIPYSLMNGNGYMYRGVASAYFGPLYTYLWAGLISLFGIQTGQMVLQIIQSLCLSIAAVGVYAFSRRYFVQQIALLASAWFAFYPELLIISSTHYSESVVLSLWCLVLALYALAVDKELSRRRDWISALLGLSIGLLILAKGRMLAFSAVVLAAYLIESLRTSSGRFSLSSRMIGPLLAGAVAVLIVLPWTARNYYTFARFVPVESTMGLNLWLGHNEAANGTGKAALGTPLMAQLDNTGPPRVNTSYVRPPELQEKLATCDTEIVCDDIYRREAILFIVSSPVEELELSARKAFYAWWFDPTSGGARHPLYRLPWVITLVLFALGLIYRLVKERRFDPLPITILVISTLLQIVFFVVPRLRYPVFPIVFTYASLGSVVLINQGLERLSGDRQGEAGYNEREIGD